MLDRVRYSRQRIFQVGIALVIFAAGIVLGAGATQNDTSKTARTDTFTNGELETDDFDLVFETWKSVRDKYIDEEKIDLEHMVYGSVKGFINALNDPYTTFMDPEETQGFRENLDAELQGIGAEIAIEDGYLVILTPLKESPAEKAGLLPGDYILEVDGSDTSEMTLLEAVMKIRGEKGTSVKLLIARKDVSDPFGVTIIRDDIKIESVTWEMLDGNIFYISINQFSDDTKKEFNAAISEMLLKKPRGMILDLRYNGGGYLDMAVEILSELLPGEKEAVRIKRRNGQNNEIFYTDGAGRATEIPLAVLVNQGSASSSEIVAGAIQDYHRGKLYGVATFGKGSVQEVEYLSDGSSLRLTIAKWLTPKGRSIDDAGIQPDQIVEMTPEDIEAKRDPQKQAAVDYLKRF